MKFISINFMKNYRIYFTEAMGHLPQLNPLWRGSLLPLGREAAPTQTPRSFRQIALTFFGAAAHPSGSKLPRHNGGVKYEEIELSRKMGGDC
ncbi:hypothetical protein [Pseudomonas sp. GXZC]|uniref:hypothetical protein n=1 Tax=Pseudomonas sp. GXZC TaxID=3003351 RepID=UPI0022AAE095|nr:hypothetical protein [Pseudomonas sp. GXZC]WAT31088.1 hypothetical protein OZ428_12385 [Pseudomonas sp. GXZC]